MRERTLVCAVGVALAAGCMAGTFNGLTADMASLCRLSDARSRSISPENFTGARNAGALADPVADKDKRNVANASGCARELGRGWKVNPFVKIAPGETLTLADIEGPGAIQHIWMTPTKLWRHSIIRMYWDDEASPSVECPVGDFFASAYNKYACVHNLLLTFHSERLCDVEYAIVSKAVCTDIAWLIHLICRLSIGLEATLVSTFRIRQVVYSAIDGVILVGNHIALFRIELGIECSGEYSPKN